jgi:hypothetical protein
MNNSTCFNLAEDWYKEAIQSAKEGFSKNQNNIPVDAINCASEVVRRIGGTEEEMAMVAGFAGGMGLSGNGCGALSAAIWYRSLEWVRQNPEKSAFNNKEAKAILKSFLKETQGKMVCSQICGRDFKSIEEHSDYLKIGGCQKILYALN